MRQAFISALVKLAERDERVLLLTGDLGFWVVEPFAEKFPGRFINVGVAEQNMVGIATGLAESGLIPFVYSIVPFATLRPYEFIRNGPVAHGLPVRIVGVGGGYEYGTAGPTHHGLEDLAAMRQLDGMTVLAPADVEQACAALDATWDLDGPVYYRLGKDESTVVPGLGGRFCLGRAEGIGSGKDVVLVATGAIASEAAVALTRLGDRGVAASLLIVASLSPPPVDDLIETLGSTRAALTIEAHRVTGGLGSLVCEIVAEAGLSCRVRRCGVRGDDINLKTGHRLSEPAPRRVRLGGGERYLNTVSELTGEQLAQSAVALLHQMHVSSDTAG